MKQKSTNAEINVCMCRRIAVPCKFLNIIRRK